MQEVQKCGATKIFVRKFSWAPAFENLPRFCKPEMKKKITIKPKAKLKNAGSLLYACTFRFDFDL